MGKNVIKALVGLFFFAALGLTGCGGGGGGAADTQTPTGTVVSMAAFKSVYLGTSAGAQYSFPTLSGSDSQGRSWSGSFTVIADGTTSFESQSVTKQHALVSLQLAGGTPVTGTSTAYFQASNGNPYKSIESNGVTYTPNSAVTLPATAKVGDFGDLGTYTGTDGTTESVTWTLAAGSNGASTLALSSIIKTGTTINSVEMDSFHLDASGVPTSISISVTESGVTVNLAGNKS